MATIDKLLQTMTQRAIKRAIIISDQPLRLFDDLGEKKGAIVESEWIETSLFEITPHYLNEKLTQDGRFQFQHDCSHGSFQITVERAMDKVKLYVVRLVASVAISTAPVSSAPASTNTLNDSGNGLNSLVPSEVQEWSGGWNRGAFMLPWPWCFAHNAWVDLAVWSLGSVMFFGTWIITQEFVMAMISLTIFGGPVLLYMLLRFGSSANQTAWQNRKWDSVAHFEKVQRIWFWWAKVAWIFTPTVFFFRLESLFLLRLHLQMILIFGDS